jgi:hypothetical protein
MPCEPMFVAVLKVLEEYLNIHHPFYMLTHYGLAPFFERMILHPPSITARLWPIIQRMSLNSEQDFTAKEARQIRHFKETLARRLSQYEPMEVQIHPVIRSIPGIQ